MNITHLFGTKLPIIQAPMAGVQNSALAIAVSNAGGLGSLPCAMLTPDSIRGELAEMKAKTDQPFNVNFFCHEPPTIDPVLEMAWRNLLIPYYKEFDIDSNLISSGAGRNPFSVEAADLLSEFEPAVISFHFGLPSIDLITRVRTWGAKIISSATTVEEARWLEAHGVDAIIAQGVEAGGHRGMFLTNDLKSQISTFDLLVQIIQAVKLPVIAAGGIADANGVAKAMMLGAAGVQVGTAYLLCPEATTSQVHRAALKSDAASDTVITNLFTGRPARCMVNRFIKECGVINDVVPPFPLAASAIAPLRTKAEGNGSGDFSPLWAGANAHKCKELSAAEITRGLVSRFK
jgi:nitronate monooxygenase